MASEEGSSSPASSSSNILNIPKPPSMKQETDSEDDASGWGPESSEDGKSHFLGGGKLTLSTLIQEDLIRPGEGVMSIDYLGQTFKGDLSPGGKIKSQETGLVFNNPSAWAIYCKKIVNPSKKSGCGWASVKYKGRKMDHYKNTWMKMRLQQQQGTQSVPVAREESPEKTLSPSLPPPGVSSLSPAQQPPPLSLPSTPASQSTPDPLPPPPPPPPKIILNPQQQLQLQQLKLVPPNHAFLIDPQKVKDCVFQHSQLGPKMPGDYVDALVEPESFPTLGKMQPFTVSISSSVCLVIDLHSHVNESAVCGYLAGQWDLNAHNVAVTHVFPVVSRDAVNMERSKAVETETSIYNQIYSKHLTLLGWYHSRPNADRALPSLKDVETQLDFQIKMLGVSDATYTPCIGMIVSTYGPSHGPSETLTYWVIPPPETNNGTQEYGKPLSLAYHVVSDPCLSSEVLETINAVIEDPVVPLHEIVPGSELESYITRLGATIVPKFPRDQDERLWRYIRNRLLKPEFRGIEDPILSSATLFKGTSISMGSKGEEEDEIDDDEENALKIGDEQSPFPAHSIFPIKTNNPFVLHSSTPLDFSAKKET